MNYYSSDDRNEDFGRINQSILPIAKKPAYLNEKAIRTQLKRGRNAVNLSIIKWRIIRRAYRYLSERPVPAKYYADLLPLLSYRTCALCLQAFDRYTEAHGAIENGSARCRFCPLAAIDCCTEEGSIFRQIESVLHRPEFIYSVPADALKKDNDRLGSLIDAMSENLHKLNNRPPI